MSSAVCRARTRSELTTSPKESEASSRTAGVQRLGLAQSGQRGIGLALPAPVHVPGRLGVAQKQDDGRHGGRLALGVKPHRPRASVEVEKETG